MKKISPRLVAVETGPNGSVIFIRQSYYPDPTEPQGIELYIGSIGETCESTENLWDMDDIRIGSDNFNECLYLSFIGARMIRPFLTKEQVVDLANTLLAIADNEMWISTAKFKEE